MRFNCVSVVLSCVLVYPLWVSFPNAQRWLDVFACGHVVRAACAPWWSDWPDMFFVWFGRPGVVLTVCRAHSLCLRQGVGWACHRCSCERAHGDWCSPFSFFGGDTIDKFLSYALHVLISVVRIPRGTDLLHRFIGLRIRQCDMRRSGGGRVCECNRRTFDHGCSDHTIADTINLGRAQDVVDHDPECYRDGDPEYHGDGDCRTGIESKRDRGTARHIGIV